MSTLISCKNLCKSYGKKKVIRDLNLEIESGRIVGILGPNGSGKTTLIKLLCGLLQANSGGASIHGMPVGIDTKKIVSYLPERTYLSDYMTVRDAIRFFEDFYEDFQRQTAIEMLERLNLSIDSKIKTLSKGNREKIQLILVMSRHAKLYLLDEPIGGVDPAARDYILKTILGNYNEDATIVITTHLINDVEKILDDIVFIRDGDVILHQQADELRLQKGKSVDALFRETFAC